MKRFYLGTHMVNWLWDSEIPLFISHRRLARQRKYRPARSGWALDSGGFSELSMYGEWRTSPGNYVESVRRYIGQIGNLEFAAIQDWMCEPWITGKTGLTVLEHQRRTITSYLELRQMAPEVPWLPVVQGLSVDQYQDHVEMYSQSGVNLSYMDRVGVGSVCRRQGTIDAVQIVEALHGLGLKTHLFGVKTVGLKKFHELIESSDSMAWSYRARRNPVMEGCVGHKTCSNCRRYAEDWYRRVLSVFSPEEV